MKFTGAIKRLKNAGFTVKLSDIGGIATATKPKLKKYITINKNGIEDDVAVIVVNRFTDKPDPLSDYYPGSYHKTLKSAIRYCNGI